MRRSEMTESEIDLPVTLDADAVVTAVENVGTNGALHVTMKSTLDAHIGTLKGAKKTEFWR